MDKIICRLCNKEIKQDHFFELVAKAEGGYSVMHVNCEAPIVPIPSEGKILPAFVASRW